MPAPPPPAGAQPAVFPLQPPPFAPPPPPPAPRPAEEAADATRMMDRSEITPPAPQSTEMMQWYGMLTCTAGALEGQRFIVEEEGFFIGRDPQFSKVVINDGRISKRHVHIVPRDGRVHAIDEGSTNGTFIGQAGGERVTDVQLRRGDVLVLADGAAAFLYQV